MTPRVYVTLEDELKKNPKLKIEDINRLQEWLKEQLHLPEMMDHELALFLHGNSYTVELAKINIEKYYNFRSQIPEFFSDLDPVGNPDLQQAFKVISFTPMKNTTNEGYKVIVGRLLDSDPAKFSINDSLKYLCMVLDELLYHEGTMKGYIILVDTSPVKLEHVGRMGVMMMKTILTYVQEALPFNLKGLHFMNINSTMDMILKVIKPFIKKDLADLLFMHPNLKSLKKHVPLEMIPNELGGKAGALQELHKVQIDKLEELRDWFLEKENRERVDESERKKKRKVSLEKTGHDMFEGNFKKLDYD